MEPCAATVTRSLPCLCHSASYMKECRIIILSSTVRLTLDPRATLLRPSVGKLFIAPSSRQTFWCRIIFVSQRQTAGSPPRANFVAIATANTPQSCELGCVSTLMISKWTASEEHLKKEQIIFFILSLTLKGHRCLQHHCVSIQQTEH